MLRFNCINILKIMENRVKFGYYDMPVVYDPKGTAITAKIG